MIHHGNVTKINGAEVEPVDVITFGSPCQDLSVAGKRAGIQDGERSNLFFEAVRIIKEMREATNGEYPKYAVWENVPGAFSSNKGYDFHAVLEALCSVCNDTVSIPEPYDAKRTKLVWSKAGEVVGDNYSVAWRTLDAQYWGVPQRRKRIYLVADFGSQRAGEILFKPDSLRRDMQEGDETWQGSTADAVGGVDGSVGNCLAAGFCQGASPAAQTIGYQEEIAPTVKGAPSGTAQVPAVVLAQVQDGSETARTLAARYDSSPCADRGQNIAVIAFAQNQRDEVRDLGDKAGALAAEAGVHQQTYVAQPVIAMATQQGGAEIAENLCPTITAAAGMSGNNQPVIALQANGIDQQGGKGGANYSENMMPPICSDSHGTPHAVCFEPGAMVRDMGNRIWEEQSPTLRANMGDNQTAVCYDARGNGDGETACTITGDHQNRITDYTAICVGNGQLNQISMAKQSNALDCMHDKQAIITDGRPPRKYIIRRLTPTECARLQGFPDDWGKLAPYNPADAEFWEDVRKTHAEITGKKYKPTKNLKKWYEGLHTDSAEYKMWGNGIALPNATYVLEGIAEQGAKTLGSLFDGSGGFPLAGAMNGITPLWASEIEPYPIAVTKSRFREDNNG